MQYHQLNQLRVLTAALLAIPGMAFAAAGNGVTISGTVNVEYSAVKIDQVQGAGGGLAANNRYQKAIADPTFFSRWALGIREDLGGGLAAIGKIEFAFSPGTGVAEVAREQWVGLSSKDWGTFHFGSVNAPFKVFAGGASVDRFIGTGLHLRGSGGAMYAPSSGFGTGAFVDHAIAYTSPGFGNGWSFAAVLAPSNASQADATTANTNQRNGNTGGRGNGIDYQFAFKYNIPKVGDVFTGYSRDSATDAQRAQGLINGKIADDETVFRVGANLKFGNIGVYGQYDQIENALNTFNLAALATASGNGAAGCAGGAAAGSGGDVGSSTQQCNNSLNVNGDGTIWNLGVSYTLGKTMLVLQGGQTNADAVGTALERKAKNITAGAIYSLSKRTRVHAGYQHVSIEGARLVNQIGLPTPAFPGQAGAALAVQPDRSTFSMGMRHTF